MCIYTRMRKLSGFLCLGGWEEEIPYNSLPGTGYTNYWRIMEDQNENGRGSNYGNLYYEAEQTDENEVFQFQFVIYYNLEISYWNNCRKCIFNDHLRASSK